jgi:acyl transferase domain-containing protein
MAEQPHPSAIAVVGLSCRFPGARGADSYWANLRAGVESIRRFTPQELLAAGVERSLLESPRYVRAAPALEGVELFDAPFFGFSPRQAVLTDPQQRLLLECAYEALEDSGFHPARLGGAVGVFASSSLSHYLLAHLGHTQRVAGGPDSLPAYLGNDKDYLATQVAYQLDLRGPAVTVQTACSSSLVAVHLACQALLGGECELALAGASVVRVPQVAGYLYEEEGIFSPDGHCRPFDAQARGTLFGSGVGVVALKRLERALADGDSIRAVIRGTAINNDGARKVAYHAPSMDGQAAAISEALMLANVEPDSVSYVEAHGTGTLLGDPIEVAALTRVFRASTSRRGFCGLGSVKGNLGHLENAAGMAALIKAVLALQHRELPASLHFHTPNPHIDFESSPFRVNAALTPWAQGPTPRRAGVSSFGMGGTNAHVVLEEAPPPRPAPRRRAGEAWLLPLSARSPEALSALAERYQAWLPSSTAEVGDVAHTASVRRQHHPHRVAVVGRTREELTERLQAFARGEVRAGHVPPGVTPRVAFLFPGQGSQWVGMGRELMGSEPSFRQALERCEVALRPHMRRSLREVLEGSGALLEELDLVQPTLFALQVALAELWRSWGVQPDVVVGHSMGEVAAACVAGALSLEEAARVIALRSRLALRVRGQGTMAVVGLTLEEARQALRGLEDRLSVAVSSSPRSTVLSGDPRALEELLASLQARNVFTGRIKVDFASHSPQVEPLLAELRQLLSGLRPRAGSTPLFSTVEGALVDGSGWGADYWARNLREPVLFSSAIEHLSASGTTTFLEVSPHPILLPAVEQVLAHHGRQGAGVGSLRREQPERAALLDSLGSLYSLGHSVHLERLHPEGGAQVQLPSYPWQHRRYWPEEEARSTGLQPTGAHPLLGQRLRSPLAQAQYERRWSARSPAFVSEHQVLGQPVVPGAALALVALAAARSLHGSTPVALEQVELQELLALPREQGARTVQVLVGPRGSEPSAVQVLSASEEESQGWVLHASGRLRPYTPEPPASPWQAQAVRERCAQSLEGATLAGLLQAVGVELGPALRWLEQLWLGEGEALGRLRPPTAADTTPEVGWVDACFQLAGLAAGGVQALRAGALYLPVRLVHLHLAEGTGPAVYAHARVQPGAGQPGELVGDVELWDEAGQRVAQARGVVVRRVERAALERSLGGSDEPWLHEVVFRPLATPATPARSERGRWLLLADEGRMGQALARALQARGEACTVALPGEQLERLDAGLYRVSLRNPQELARLLAEAEGAPLPWRAAVYLVGAESALRERPAQALAAEVERTTGGLLRLAQALASQPRGPRLWVATRGTQPVTEAPVALAQAALWGLGRTLAQEHPEVWGGAGGSGSFRRARAGHGPTAGVRRVLHTRGGGSARRPALRASAGACGSRARAGRAAARALGGELPGDWRLRRPGPGRGPAAGGARRSPPGAAGAAHRLRGGAPGPWRSGGIRPGGCGG